MGSRVGALEEITLSLLPLKASYCRSLCPSIASGHCQCGRCLHVPPIVGHNSQDGPFKDLVDAPHFLTAAFHILGSHLLGNGHSLLCGDGREALGLQHVDTRFFVPEI